MQAMCQNEVGETRGGGSTEGERGPKHDYLSIYIKHILAFSVKKEKMGEHAQACTLRYFKIMHNASKRLPFFFPP